MQRGDEGICAARNLSSASLRAQRSNPETVHAGTLDCFAALAMTVWIEFGVGRPNRLAESPRHPDCIFDAIRLSPRAGRGEG
ncbi:hypothetical protein CT676_17005 [Bradyrhizobium sp. MOS001]|nr:hypothetical protein CT676_17005 [Bradyrhizobium sp. MOS001]